MRAERRRPEPHVAHELPGRVRFVFPSPRLTRGREAGIRKALDEVTSVRRYRVNPSARSATVEFEPGSIDAEALRRVIAEAQDVDPSSLQAASRNHHSHVPAMLSIAAGSVLAMAGQPLAIPFIAAGAAPIFGRAARRLTGERKIGVDALDAAAFAIAIGSGQVVTGAFMAALIEGGEWMRDLTASRSKRALGALMSHQDAPCWKVKGRTVVRARTGDISAGDIVAVGPGDRIPVDGDVLSGEATVDERLLTGEPTPVVRNEGASVYAMTVVGEGSLHVVASGPASESRAGRIMAFLESAPIGETRMADHARLIADRLVMPVLGLAAGAYLLTGNASRAASILIFDLATGIRVAAPTTMLAALIGAAREGVLIKGAAAIEKLARVDTIVFDKTGTLTIGEPAVVDVRALNGLKPAQVLGIAAAADRGINHPLAAALLAEAKLRGAQPPDRTDFKYHVGLGVEGTFRGGRKYLVGNRRFMAARGLRAPERPHGNGAVSEVFVSSPEECLGAIYLRDQARSEASGVVDQMRQLGVKRVVVLTGDTNSAAEGMAESLGIGEWRARVSPEDKADFVRQLKADGHVVAMVGDGINDSLAFTLADVPVAMGAGADVARDRASVVLLENRLELLPVAIHRAREALGIMNQNFGLIAAPNAMGLGAAVVANMNPAVAALISNGSAVAAAANGLRPLVRERPKR